MRCKVCGSGLIKPQPKIHLYGTLWNKTRPQNPPGLPGGAVSKDTVSVRHLNIETECELPHNILSDDDKMLLDTMILEIEEKFEQAKKITGDELFAENFLDPLNKICKGCLSSAQDENSESACEPENPKPENDDDDDFKHILAEMFMPCLFH